MPNFRRFHVPGGCYFFTVNIFDRKSMLLVERIDDLYQAIKYVKKQRPFHIDACVVLPDHLHCIWILPIGDDDFPGRWREIKKRFSKATPKTESRSAVQIRRHERGIWQRRFWEHAIRNDKDFGTHMDYVHYNPVKYGWVEKVVDWSHSTFHGLVEKGIYPRDWSSGPEVELDVGERRSL